MPLDKIHEPMSKGQRRFVAVIGFFLYLAALGSLFNMSDPSGYAVYKTDDMQYPCFDVDAGNIYKSASLAYKNSLGNKEYLVDKCKSSNILIENNCVNLEPKSLYITCKNGCKQGACIR